MPSRKQLANAIRALSMDAVQKANSGHPGMPMGMADLAEVLWNDFLKHNPTNPYWVNRDRFIVSNGHGSMLLYSLLHLTGYDLSMDDLKNFRQLHSKTPGHPEFGYTPGVETTTGPLGQGIANAVGMAIAAKALAEQFNRDDYSIIDHLVYVFMGDGCLMEGISHEVSSIAGTLGLGNLICFWDDNEISIDGHVSGWFTDDTPGRFRAYGWHVVENVDGHDPEQIKRAVEEARSVTDKPTLICCRTVIGYGAPNAAGGSKCHGAPLGDEEIKLAKQQLGWEHDAFVVPEDVYQNWDAKQKGQAAELAWQEMYDQYKQAHPELAAEFERRIAGELPENWSQVAEEYLQTVAAEGQSIATRKASMNCLNAFGPSLPELLGGSADLSGSNLTLWSGSKPISPKDPGGNYLYYGVREFGMSAIMNGIALYGGFIPYGGTFLTFSDYARNAVRLAALMKQRSIFVYTHDSLALGEDGPTHQPVEHISMLRLTPQLNVWRPCDAVESAVAWQAAIESSDLPSCLLFSRQSLPHQERDAKQIANIKRGAYILKDCQGEPDVIIIATGSEVALAMQAQQHLAKEGKQVRVVSMPCTEVFDSQDAAYRNAVLPNQVTRRIAIEAGSKDYWYKYVGLEGKVIGLNQFGESAPGNVVMEALGFNLENVLNSIEELLEGAYA